MPELPEVETVVRELNRKLAGKTIRRVAVLLGKMVSLGAKTVPPKRKSKAYQVRKFLKWLKGQTIKSVSRRAKLIIIDFAPTSPSHPLSLPLGQGEKGEGRRGMNLALLVHLKMTGQFIYLKKSQLQKQIRVINKKTAPLLHLPTKFTHAVFDFTDGSKLFYNDVRQFGYLRLVSDKELLYVKELSEFGPEPLSREFTFPVFQKILARRPNAKIKQLLTEQKSIAGIGNIYSDEILFRAKVRPDRKVSSIKYQELKKIYSSVKQVLKQGIAARGSSVGDFVRTDGSWGKMGKYHYVYARGGLACKVCGTIIKSVKFSGRTGSFCPKCQK